MAHEGSLNPAQKARDFKFTLAKHPKGQTINYEPSQFVAAMNSMSWP